MSLDAIPALVVDGRIATITLQRPASANRLSSEDLQALLTHLAAVNANEDILVLRVRATGKYFCSGFNLNDLAAGTSGPFFGEVVDQLEQARPVTIAAINGPLYGGATDLALACDFRIGVAAAEMSVPAVKIGLHFYLSGQERYVSRIGLGAAKRLLLTGAKFTSAEMIACGFLDEAVADEAALDAAVAKLSATLAELAPLALLPMKKSLNQIARGALDKTAGEAAIARADASEDFAEGRRALMEKRPPVFKGR